MSDYFKPKDVFQQLLIAAIHKMDLVTREEFDIQTRVLQKTRQKVEQLEKLLENTRIANGNI